jgi:HD-like signal output (HDOD) protein
MHPNIFFAALLTSLIVKVAASPDQYYVRGNGVTDIQYNSTLVGTYQVSSLIHCMALSARKAWVTLTMHKTEQIISRIWLTATNKVVNYFGDTS